MSKNRFCELMNIEYPIVQAPMNWITGARLAAAVSNAGGLGCIGPNGGAKTMTNDINETAERLRLEIRKARTLTNKPFAVNFPIASGNGSTEFSRRCIDVAIEEKIDVAITSVGSPKVYTQELKAAGIKVIHAVSTPGQAVKAEKAGVDVVVCEGFEGGGHKAITGMTTMTMTPMASQAVNIPIIAAGGIADAKGVAAALVLGADAVYLGTRFMVTDESDAHPNIKKAMIEGQDVCTVAVPKWTVTARSMINNFTNRFMKAQSDGASDKELFGILGEHTAQQALVDGDVENGEFNCGQIAGLIEKQITAAEVVEGIIRDLPGELENLKQKISF